jgi:hypothetical protein
MLTIEPANRLFRRCGAEFCVVIPSYYFGTIEDIVRRAGPMSVIPDAEDTDKDRIVIRMDIDEGQSALTFHELASTIERFQNWVN